MKRFALIAFLLSAIFGVRAEGTWNVPDETLHYNVRFKWGIIDANVGIATLSTHSDPGQGTFVATLSGKSVDLLGHYYEAGDTVEASMLHGALRFPQTETIDAEHGVFSIETITSDNGGKNTDGPVVGHLPDGRELRSRTSQYGSGLTIDLLSVFYYIREIDYSKFQPGQRFIINLHGAGSAESLHVSYIGTDNVDVNGVSYMGAFHISLTFGGAQASKIDSLEVWIADNDSHVPVKIDGSLSVGRIECRFIDQSSYSRIAAAN